MLRRIAVVCVLLRCVAVVCMLFGCIALVCMLFAVVGTDEQEALHAVVKPEEALFKIDRVHIRPDPLAALAAASRIRLAFELLAALQDRDRQHHCGKYHCEKKDAVYVFQFSAPSHLAEALRVMAMVPVMMVRVVMLFG